MPRNIVGSRKARLPSGGPAAPCRGLPGLCRLLVFTALFALSLPEAKVAHICYNERRWTDTAADGSITRNRCLLDAAGDACASAVDSRPWSQDTLLSELLGLARERAFAVLMRIDSVNSSYRDTAYVVDGVALVDRHMSEDVRLTVVETYKGDVETGPMVFRERWNMGNVQGGGEYSSFYPGRGQWYLAFYDPGAGLGELVRPANECDRNLSGFRVADGRIAKSGEYSFPQLSIPLDLFKSALPLASVRRGKRDGRMGEAHGPELRTGRPGESAGTRFLDALGRRHGGERGKADGAAAFGVWIGDRMPDDGNLERTGPGPGK